MARKLKSFPFDSSFFLQRCVCAGLVGMCIMVDEIESLCPYISQNMPTVYSHYHRTERDQDQ